MVQTKEKTTIVTEREHYNYIWHDGQIIPWDEATVHVTDLEWSGVSSVFEGIKAYRNDGLDRAYIFRLDEHMARFANSMKLMRMNPEFSIDELKEAILELLRANDVRQDTYIRPFAYFGPGKWFGRMAETPTHLLINSFPFESHLKTDHKLNCCISSWTRISDNVMPPRVKAVCNYQNSRLAATEADLAGYDGAILLNEQRKVAEGPGACIMIVQRGKVATPPVTSGILESITRYTLIHLLRHELGIEVAEREIDRTELYLADEAFFCGTGAEVSPIISIDRYPLGNGEVGPITRQMADLYHDLVRGTDHRYPEWRTLV
ncbi:MAG: branched-chain amino acid transaminase [Anaerolineae bacterium]